MSFDRIVEALIQEAMARGEFENLPSQGKPIELTEYFNTPEDVRVAQAMLKNAGVVPVELELLEEITALKELLSSSTDEGKKAEYRKSLVDKQLEFNLLLERRRRSSRK
jgi:DnaJ homologue, subfamily C, member 28, conserved domain